MMKANKDIRRIANRKGIYLWQIADRMGLHDSNLSRLLRKELSREEKERIFQIIDELAKERDREEDEKWI